MAETRRQRALVWLDPDQTDLVRRILDRVGVDVAAAGSPQLGRSADVVAELKSAAAEGADIEPVSDLRAALTRTDADFVLLAAPGDFGGGASDGDDVQALVACRARGLRVVSFEPLPASLLQLDTPGLGGGGTIAVESAVAPHGATVQGAGEGRSPRAARSGALVPSAGGGEWATFCPLAGGAGPLRDAAEVLEQIGPPLMVAIESWCGPGQGSLGARLFDAMDLVVRLAGEPEQIDAAYVWPLRGRPLHAAPGETLHGLSGHLTANMRFAEGRSATIAVSDRAGRWRRTATVVGEGGRLMIDDGGFVWVGQDGREVDSSRRGMRDAGDATAYAAGVFAEHLVRLLDPAIPAGGGGAPTDYPRTLAATGAALLSARTGENESPATIMRMARAG